MTEVPPITRTISMRQYQSRRRPHQGGGATLHSEKGICWSWQWGVVSDGPFPEDQRVGRPHTAVGVFISHAPLHVEG